MRSTLHIPDDLRRSVLAVPPLCRNHDLSLNIDENAKLVRHLESGGVRTLLYGGNANLYNIAVSEYPALLDMLETIGGADTLVIPSVGPFYGALVDQAAMLRGRRFPTAMVLPTLFPASSSGVQTAVRHFVESAGVPAGLYIKDEHYVTPEATAELVVEGTVTWIKYAIVRDNPRADPYLAKLTQIVDPSIIVSGIGEQPTSAHFRGFGLRAFTSGCVCVRPDLSMKILHALASGDDKLAEDRIAMFKELENLRDKHGPIPVLHHAVAGAGVAATGPLYPLLSPLEDTLVAEVAQAANSLRQRHT